MVFRQILKYYEVNDDYDGEDLVKRKNLKYGKAKEIFIQKKEERKI